MRSFGLIVLFMWIAGITYGQIVNVEGRRLKSDTTGWLGSMGTSVQVEKSAVRVINIQAEAQLEYKAPRSLYLFLINYNLLRGADQTLQNNVFAHIRYNYKLNRFLRWEAFSQLQNNNVTGIQSRFLLGTGPRFKLSDTKKLALYAATAAMYESEIEITKPPVHHKDIRSSSYASASWRPIEKTEVITTVFYQPIFTDVSDFRLLHELTLKFNFTKNFAFLTTWNYLFDSEPAAEKPKENYLIKNGIRYEF